VAIRERFRALRTEFRPGADDEGVMREERDLRRATQAEHGEAVVTRDEADGEHAARQRAQRSSRSIRVNLVGRAQPQPLVRAFSVEP